MARYKVDKKAFDERQLEEQLLQVELQSKYLRDEPLRRSEVDEYNKLRANGWVKNTLISLGVIFSTAIAIIIFVLLGNMLMTNGRTGEVGKYSLNSTEVYTEFLDSEYYPDNSMTSANTQYIEYKIPGDTLQEVGGNLTDHVVVIYTLTWVQEYDQSNNAIPGQGYWYVGRDGETKTVGALSQLPGTNNTEYQLDSSKVDLNTLMTNWFKSQEDGWAKSMIEDFFYTAWPLTVVLWLVFFLTIAAYATVLVVGIRYVIRSILVILRRAGYIASDFAKEVVETVKSEIPIVEVDQVEELNISDMKREIEEKLKEGRNKTLDKNDDQPLIEKPPKKSKEPKVETEPKVEIEQVETEENSEKKSGKDEIKSIFD